jgi:hypothetical protein
MTGGVFALPSKSKTTKTKRNKRIDGWIMVWMKDRLRWHHPRRTIILLRHARRRRTHDRTNETSNVVAKVAGQKCMSDGRYGGVLILSSFFRFVVVVIIVVLLVVSHPHDAATIYLGYQEEGEVKLYKP